MSVRVCLVTTGQPATNPRAVKEADALAAAGYDVHMIGAFAGAWAVDAEPAFMRDRAWSLEVVDWRREADASLFWQSGVRHRAAGQCAALAGRSLEIAERAVARPAIELRRRAMRWHADLYVAHNVGALPAAARAAARNGAKLGFDAEDFHSGQFDREAAGTLRAATVAIERHYLPRCDYVTASSPGIAAAYRSMLGGGEPAVVLNVCSRRERSNGSAARAGMRPARRSGDPMRLYWFSQTIGPGRGLEDAVRAMASLPAGVELHLRGSWAAGYEARLRGLARGCGVAEGRIVAHPMAAPGAMVDEASRFDVGLALEPGHTPNNRFAISNKLFTCLMAALPVVATRTPGQDWLLERVPSAGWAYDPGDVSELSRLLRRCFEEPSAVGEASAAASHAACTRFCWEVEQHILLETVARVVSDRRGRPVPTPHAARAFDAGPLR